MIVPMLGASRAGIEDSFLVSCFNNFQNVFASTEWSYSKNNNFAFLTVETIQTYIVEISGDCLSVCRP